MIAMLSHPRQRLPLMKLSHLKDVLHDVEQKALVSLDKAVDYTLQDKIVDGKLYVEQGIIAGCAGGGFENICAAADIIKGRYIGADEFTFSVYPASTLIYMELVKNGAVATLMEKGTIVKTAFCGPCFGAEIRLPIMHSPSATLQETSRTEKALLPERTDCFRGSYGCPLYCGDGCKQGIHTPATAMDEYMGLGNITLIRISMRTVSLTARERQTRPWRSSSGRISKDSHQTPALPENLVLKVVSEIHEPVTTTDELIPSGETSSYRSNPLGLAEFALSRKDPAYVGRAKEVQKAQKAIEAGQCPLEVLDELKPVMDKVRKAYPEAGEGNLGVGSTIFAVKPGDGSAREQAASCQKVLGGWANIANEYATKRYRSNLINWGMLPFVTKEEHESLSFKNGDYLFVPDIRKAVEEKAADNGTHVVRKT